MSALESLLAASGEADLSESLTFDLAPSSTAIVDCQTSCRAYPTSSSTLSLSGTRTLRIRLGGDSFVDPRSIRLRYTITNTDATAGTTLDLAPISGPWCVWGLFRCLVNGVEVDNFQYNRMHELFGWRMLTMEQQYSEAVYGWHSSYVAAAATGPHPTIGTIKAGASVTVSHKIFSAMTNQTKMLALRYAPMDFEFSLANITDGFFSQAACGTPKFSQSFTISNVQIQYNASVLDESIQESFYKSLLSNRVLNTPISQTFSLIQSIPAGSTSYTFSIVRAYSKLTHIWITFRSASGAVCNGFNYPSTLTTSQLASMGTNPVFDAELPSPSIRVSLGAKNWPAFEPVATAQEHYWQLMQALPSVPMIDRKDFMTNTFVSVFDLRRTPGDASSAYSTRQGDQVRVQIAGLQPWDSTGTAPQGPIEVNVTLVCLACLATRESGCQILD